jgi:beta-fructofuranosidase
MNDPNGPIEYKGTYHLFYQFNPYGDSWGNMHWGHARSKDLMHWEQLPIALWPSKEKGEDHVFSGCATIGPDGKPILFYTSIGRDKVAGDSDQWAAVPADDDLITWKKHPENPLLTKKLHGDTTVQDWRDPYVFKDGGRTFMVVGGGIGNGTDRRGVVNLYESKSPELTDWTYRGVLWKHPELPNIECPNFFKLGDRYVLIISPHGKVQTFVGSFDPEAGRFTSERQAILDEGQLYAPNVFFDKNGRALLWGWLNGFKPGSGWNGCMTLPRVLSLGPDHELLQAPAPEVANLRGAHLELSRWKLDEQGHALEGPKSDSVEILAEFVPGDEPCGFDLRVADDGTRGTPVSFDGRSLTIAGQRFPFSLREGEQTIKLHVFLDRSVLEVFANDRFAAAVTIQPPATWLRNLAAVPEGRKSLKRLDAWTIPTEGVFLDKTAPPAR